MIKLANIEVLEMAPIVADSYTSFIKRCRGPRYLHDTFDCGLKPNDREGIDPEA